MIRWKFFLSVLVLLAVIAWILTFRLDSWVKNALESGISAVTGTKTDISGLEISLRNSSLQIGRLEIASKKEPMENVIELSQIIVDFQTLPLLEKRFIVDDFSVKGIQWGTKRRASGVLPPKPMQEDSWFGGISDKAFDKLQAEYNELPVSQLTSFAIPDNLDEVLKRLEFPAIESFKKIASDAQESKLAWAQRVKEVADLSDEKNLIQEARKLTKDLPQDPQEIAKRVQQIQSFIGQLDEQKSSYEKLIGKVREDYESAEKMYRSADSLVQQTYKQARSLMGVSALDTSFMLKVIFGSQWVQYAHETIRMQNELRRILSHLTQGSDEGVQIYPRSKGRDIIFVTPRKRPAFVLAKSDFSVNVLEKGERTEINQKYSLSLKHINSAPSLYGKPMEAKVNAMFKEMMVSELDALARWDYTKAEPRDFYQGEIKRIRASSWPVGIPKLFPLEISSGTADAKINFDFQGSNLSWRNVVQFRDVKWNFSDVPKAGVLVPILEKVFSDLKDFSVEFTLTSRNQALDFDVQSDVGELIQSGVKKYLEQKVSDLDRRVRGAIDRRIESSKMAAAQELESFRSEMMNSLNSKIAVVDQSKLQLKGLSSEITQKARGAAEEKVKSRLREELKKNAPSLPKLKF